MSGLLGKPAKPSDPPGDGICGACEEDARGEWIPCDECRGQGADVSCECGGSGWLPVWICETPGCSNEGDELE